jgi:hypothetical protein
MPALQVWQADAVLLRMPTHVYSSRFNPMALLLMGSESEGER